MLIALLALLLAAPAAAAAGRIQSETVVRVTVGLVQVDAVVTDKQGRQATDLASADFVIKQGGQERATTHVSCVRLTPEAASGATSPGPSASWCRTRPPPPAARTWMGLVASR